MCSMSAFGEVKRISLPQREIPANDPKRQSKVERDPTSSKFRTACELRHMSFRCGDPDFVGPPTVRRRQQYDPF